jgi:hypothetical protein
MLFFNLEVLKGKPTKSIWIMTHLHFQKICFWDKEIEKQTKIATRMDLWKYGPIWTIQKSLTIKWLSFSKKSFMIWVYHFVFHQILNPNNNFGLWINIIFFHFLMFQSDDQSLCFDFKSSLLLRNEILINK